MIPDCEEICFEHRPKEMVNILALYGPAPGRVRERSIDYVSLAERHILVTVHEGTEEVIEYDPSDILEVAAELVKSSLI